MQPAMERRQVFSVTDRTNKKPWVAANWVYLAAKNVGPINNDTQKVHPTIF